MYKLFLRISGITTSAQWTMARRLAAGIPGGDLLIVMSYVD
jgi:hypothetical protein